MVEILKLMYLFFGINKTYAAFQKQHRSFFNLYDKFGIHLHLSYTFMLPNNL
jgi:hypothetical protein